MRAFFISVVGKSLGKNRPILLYQKNYKFCTVVDIEFCRISTVSESSITLEIMFLLRKETHSVFNLATFSSVWIDISRIFYISCKKDLL